MNNFFLPIIVLNISLAGFAGAEGDPEKGAKDFKKCKACHTVASVDNVVVKGGKTGPNL